MATEKEILDREKEVTDKISTQVRTLSAGLIVFMWGILSAPENSSGSRIKGNAFPLVMMVDCFAALALSADFLQYVCAQVVVKKVLCDPTNRASGDFTYDDAWLSYRAQDWTFLAKQAFCGVAVLLTLVVGVVELVVGSS